MFYDGPTKTDYVNIHALNREFLRLLRSNPTQFGLDALQAARLAALGRQQMERLASTPFLLFAMQENDESAWREICSGDPNNDLFVTAAGSDPSISDLIATTVGFLWQLAKQNPYAVRMICGASQAWCDTITELTYIELITLARRRHDLVKLRQAPNADIWSKLLVDGVRAEQHVKTAAHIAVLQTLLTSHSTTSTAAWPIAACKRASLHLKVADDPGKV